MAGADSVGKLHYPAWRHHEDGRECLVESAEADAALDAGWHRSSDRSTWEGELPLGETPAADAPESQTAESASSYVPLRYPSWRHHEDGREQLVQDVDEDRALAADAGWHRSPDKTTWPDEDALGLEDASSVPDGPVAGAAPSRSPVMTADEVEQKACEQLWNTPIGDVVDALEAQTDAAVLQRVRAREVKNPKFDGGRKGVISDVDDLIARLATPPA